MSLHDPQAAGAPAPALSHLDWLEAEAIEIIREVAAESRAPVVLYSIGKDSAVLLHLVKKAFTPSPPPFPLLHVDTTWKFRDMYSLRDKIAADPALELIVHRNPEGVSRGINPFDHGALHTDLWKTEGLRQALDLHKFDAAFGGARRDEEKSRAKERILSFRDSAHRWDPRRQRPEFWTLYNARKRAGQSLRAFPMSNWTELDVWSYIEREAIELVPLYFAALRPTVERDGMILMVDDERFPLNPGEIPVDRMIRFRTLGCYPLTGAVESGATSIAAIIDEIERSPSLERSGRAIDKEDGGGVASLERKKAEGYF